MPLARMNFQLSQELILHAERNLQNAYGATPNYAFKPIADQARRSNQTIVPQRLNAALGLRRHWCESAKDHGRSKSIPSGMLCTMKTA
jgi:hypothetical protein